MALPPHLPPQTCNIKHYHRLQRVKILLAAAVFGLVAGLSGASMMIGWIWPNLGGGDIWITAQRLGVGSRTQMEERVAVDAEDRIIAVYASSEINRNIKTLSQKNFLGNAVMISSDGWSAMYLPYYSSNFHNWQVILSDGSVYGVDKILSDKLTGLTFFHLISKSSEAGSGAQFKVAGLSDKLEMNSDLYVFDSGMWQWATKAGESISSESYPHLDSAPIKHALLNSDFQTGQVVMNNQGRLAGFVVGKRILLPFQYIARLLPSVLNNQKIIYPTLGVEGWYSAEQPLVVDNTVVKGFFVSKGAGLLRAGDIILEINGQIVVGDEMWYNVKAGETVKLKVLRAGKSLDLEMKILEKKF